MAGICEYDLLGSDFGFGINAQRLDLVCFNVIAFASVEDEVGGKKEKRNIGGEFREASRGFNVDLAREWWVGLTIRAFAHRRTMNDGGRILFVERAGNGGGVEQVESGTGQPDDVKLRRESGRKLAEVIPDQPPRAGDPDNSLDGGFSQSTAW